MSTSEVFTQDDKRDKPETRVRKLTEKGLNYAIENKGKLRASVASRMTAQQAEIDKLLSEGSNLPTIRVLHKSWMTLFTEFYAHHDAYYELLSEESKDCDYWSTFLDLDTKFKTFKAKLVEWLNRAEVDKEKGHVSVSKSKTFSSMSSSTHVSVRMARAVEEQKRAELRAMQSTHKQRQALQQARFQLKQQEENLELETELKMAEARCKVFDEFIPDLPEEQLTRRLLEFNGEDHQGAESEEGYVCEDTHQETDNNTIAEVIKQWQMMPSQLVAQPITSSQPLLMSQPMMSSPRMSQPMTPSQPMLVSQPVMSSPPMSQPITSSPPLLMSQPIMSSPRMSQPMTPSQPMLVSQPVMSSPPMSQPMMSSQPVAQPVTSSQPMLVSQPVMSSPPMSQPMMSFPPTSQPMTSSQPLLMSQPVMSSQPKARPQVSMTGFLNAEARSFTPGTQLSQQLQNTGASNRAEDDVIMSVVHELQKPQADIKCFTGNPLEYKRFLRQFNSRVVAHTTDDDERMNFLDQYTKGEANKIVSGYNHLDASHGYPAALRELERRYGDVETIANAFVKKALDWPPIRADDAKGLDDFGIFLTECENAVNSIEAMRVLEYSENLRQLVGKLPHYIKGKWQGMVYDMKQRLESVKFSHLVNLVRKEAQKVNHPTYGRQALSSDKPKVSTESQVRKPFKPKGSYATELRDTKQIEFKSDVAQEHSQDHKQSKTAVSFAFDKPCGFCTGASHSFEQCKVFKAKTVKDRVEFVKHKGLCWGCLKPNHQSKNCRARATCDVCKRRHPTVLHDSSRVKEASEGVTANPCDVVHSHGIPPSMGAGTGECALAIIPVQVRNPKSGIEVQTYAFLDTGSSVNFCSSKLSAELGARGKTVQITINTMGTPHKMNTRIIKDLEIRPIGLFEEDAVPISKLYTKEQLPVSAEHIPRNKDISGWPHLSEVDIPEIDAEVGILIGNGVPDAYTPLKVATGPRGSPHATQTRLGWVVWNLVRENKGAMLTGNRAEVAAVCQSEEDENLERLVRSAINMDFPERALDTKKEPSRDDLQFMKKVQSSMIQGEDGHYTIGLPFRDSDAILPDNRSQAMKRLMSLKKRMMNDDRFATDYIDFMGKILETGYAEPVPEESRDRNDGRVWYIPHHGVYHPRKPDKIRVVFDCSMKHLGVSLNDKLLQGPNMTTNLVNVLLRFREEEIAIKADIEKMFFQVRVPPEDRDVLRFYWWPKGNLNLPPRQYRMAVHLFGAGSSPACANTALQETIRNYNKDDAMPLMEQKWYVDDFLESVKDVTEGLQHVKQAKEICAKGGFNLRQFLTNSSEVNESIAVEDQAKTLQFAIEGEGLPSERALGVVWSVSDDTLGFQNELNSKPPTRRGILSVISGVFDPLGIAGPFILPARALLQDLTRRKLEWDQVIAAEDLKKWEKWILELHELDSLRIPRCLRPVNFCEIVSCQLHLFSDASTIGYGVSAYVRLVNEKGNISCRLLMGKSRVAPIKTITIPRMELTAASTAVKFSAMITAEMNYKFDKVNYWTDSMAVLRYIYNTTSRFHTFVANRLTTIHEGSQPSEWNFVGTKENPADVASRGLSLKDQQSTEMWLKGPEFLRKPESEWPKTKLSADELPTNDPEVKKEVVAVSGISVAQTTVEELFDRFSSLSKLKRVVGWILRAQINFRKRHQNPRDANTVNVEESHCLTVKELKDAELAIVKYEQDRYLTKDFKSKGSSIYKLDPFMDETGMIRVGGRLARTSIPVETKHPILLPKNSVITKLYLVELHRINGHVGRNMMLTKLRKNYWVPRAISLISSLLAKCVSCRIYRAKMIEQKMSDLPIQRLQGGEKAFTSSGVDYFGPFEVRRGRTVFKRYGVLFTCLSTRAVHLEIASSLDMDSCINSIRRFVARRGSIKYMRSDNGTNLVGANIELKRALEGWNQDRMKTVLQQHGIEWVFNAPHASHHGGVWERLIRTVRKILYGVMKEQTIRFDDEGLQTLFCEVEAIVNGRPITVASDDPNEPEPLTPNHLLIFETDPQLPPGEFVKKDLYVRKRWRQIQFLANVFWKRWQQEYLVLLQERQKWLQPKRNVAVGDVVLVSDNTPRNIWPLGRVTDVVSDEYGLVRVAHVKTKTGNYKRPVAKLVSVLEAES